MKKISFLCISIIIFLISCNCEKGSGIVKLQEYDLENFQGIEIEDVGTLYLFYSATPKLTIETDENLLQFIDINFKKDKIKISINECITSFTKLNINLSLPNFSSLDVSDAVEVIGKDTFLIEELKIKASGTANISLAANIQKLTTEISDIGSVYLVGTAIKHESKIKDAGTLSAYNLITKETNIKITDAARSLIFVNDKLDANVSNSGELNYQGNPQDVNTNTTEAGRIKTAN